MPGSKASARGKPPLHRGRFAPGVLALFIRLLIGTNQLSDQKNDTGSGVAMKPTMWLTLSPDVLHIGDKAPRVCGLIGPGLMRVLIGWQSFGGRLVHNNRGRALGDPKERED